MPWVGQAVYEKSPHLAVATPALIRKHLFETRIANALLAFSGSLDVPGEAIGFALYFFNFSTWTGRPGLYLEDLYVKPEHRNKGIGKALFKELAIIAQDKVTELTPLPDHPIDLILGLRSYGLVCS